MMLKDDAPTLFYSYSFSFHLTYYLFFSFSSRLNNTPCYNNNETEGVFLLKDKSIFSTSPKNMHLGFNTDYNAKLVK